MAFLSERTSPGQTGAIEPFVRRDRRLVISLDQEDVNHWIVDVEIDGEWAGDGTAPTPSGALDIAMDVLYGDTNDHLNNDFGAIQQLEDE